MIVTLNIGLLVFLYSLFRDTDAALIVFDIRERKTFERAISDHTQPNGEIRKSWFKVINNRCGDIPPVKILGKLLVKPHYTLSPTRNNHVWFWGNYYWC